ncbi:MAG: HAD family hydrolase [Lachnospiraceae bacterium]
MLHNTKAVIFDLDGSLVDSMWIWKDIDRAYFAKFGLSLPEDLQSKIEGLSFTETAYYFKNHFPFPDSVEQMQKNWNEMAWDKYLHEVPMKKGVLQFLSYCKNRNIPLGIATSNSRELVEAVMHAHQLDDYFSCIMTSKEVPKGKPAPDIYLKVASGLHVAPKDCLVFEDIVPGIMAGKAAGMKVCAVEDDYSLYQTQEKKEKADYYIHDFYDIELI